MIESFFVNKILQNNIYILHSVMANGLRKSLNKIWMNWRVEN